MEENTRKILELNLLYSLDGLDGLFDIAFEKYAPFISFQYFVFNDQLTYRRQTLNAKIKSKRFRKELPTERKLINFSDYKKINTWTLYSISRGLPVSFMEGFNINVRINMAFKDQDVLRDFYIALQEEMVNVLSRFVLLNEETGLNAQIANFFINKTFNSPRFVNLSFDLILEDEYHILPHQVLKKEKN